MAPIQFQPGQRKTTNPRRLRSNRLRLEYQAMGYPNASAFAEASGMAVQIVAVLEVGTYPARLSTGEWSQHALRVATFLGTEPERLFPASADPCGPWSAAAQEALSELVELPSNDVPADEMIARREAIEALRVLLHAVYGKRDHRGKLRRTEKRLAALVLWLHGWTFASIGVAFGTSRANVHRLVANSLSELRRWECRTRILREAADGLG